MSSPKTAKCRFALVIGKDGNWNVCGGSWVSDSNDAMDSALEGLDGIDPIGCHYITVEVPIPEVGEIAGQVEEA